MDTLGKELPVPTHSCSRRLLSWLRVCVSATVALILFEGRTVCGLENKSELNHGFEQLRVQCTACTTDVLRCDAWCKFQGLRFVWG